MKKIIFDDNLVSKELNIFFKMPLNKTLNITEDVYLTNNATKTLNPVDKVIFKTQPFEDDFQNKCS